MYSNSKYFKGRGPNFCNRCINNENSHKSRGHIPITPQMIRSVIKKLHLRKVYVSSELISQYLRHHYPVDNNLKTFTEELKRKLDCAVYVGLLLKHGDDTYYLPTFREQAYMLKNSFTAFWEVYKNYPAPSTSQPRNQNKKHSIPVKKKNN